MVSKCLLFFVLIIFTRTLTAELVALELDELESIFNLDITELSQVEYTVASTKPESLTTTPAIVALYTISEMQLIGQHTLRDILSMIPGFTIQDSSLGSTTVMIRGVTETFNQKVLFLVDDVPYWMPSHGDIPLLGVPISAIESVEVIRGPGAVIYGTNASTGVIKIVTKRQDRNELSAVLGHHDRYNVNGYFHHRFESKGEFDLAFETQIDNGYHGSLFNYGIPPSFAMPVAPPTDGVIRKPFESSSLLFNYRYHNFHLALQNFSSTVNGHAGFSSTANASKLEEDGFLIRVDNSWNVGQSRWKVFADYNQFYLTIPLRNHPTEGTDAKFKFDSDGADNFRSRIGINADFAFGKKVTLFSGVENEFRSTGNYEVISISDNSVLATLFPKNTTKELAVYTQLDWQLNNWRLLLGGRYTDNEKSGSEATPRLSAVYAFNQNKSLKFLHSVGFNSPNFSQQLIQIPGAITGHEDLVAERITSSDIAYSVTRDASLYVANIYYYYAEDFITRVLESDGNHFRNASNFHRYGFELEYKSVLDDWKFNSNFSYHHQGNRSITGDDTALFAPRVSANIGLVYRLSSRHHVGGVFRYIGSRVTAPTLIQIDLNYHYKVGKHICYISLKNMTDESILHPDIQNYSITRLVPGGDSRQIEAGFTYRL